jgi:FkbM family methyltransferase
MPAPSFTAPMDAGGKYADIVEPRHHSTATHSLRDTLVMITRHPLNRHHPARALLTYLRWQIGSRVAPGQIVYNWIGGARVMVRPGETGFTGNIYCGLHEFEDMAYLLHVLRAEDVFADVGANVGSYTLLASAAKGARTFAFEPVPATFQRLVDNIRLNDLHTRVAAHNVGLAAQAGELKFTKGENVTNHVVTDGEKVDDAIMVPVAPLDSFLMPEVPAVLKIDVEGFERQVLLGAQETLAAPDLHSVIMELNGNGRRYGVDEGELLQMMRDFGFATYAYDPFARRLASLGGRCHASGNTLFIRDVDRVRERVRNAPRLAAGTTFL